MRKVILGEVLDVKRGASLSGEYYATEGNLVRLTLGNFNYPGGGFKKNTSKSDIYFNGPVKPEHILKKGDIITPLTEQVAGLLGETATIPESDKYIQSGDIGLVIPNETLLDRRFAYYLLASPIIKKQLGAAAQQTKIRHTSPDAIKACEAWIPEDIGVQKAIGQLLDHINDKISNNNAICSDLEAMAKLLYDYWFVQFDFPDENGKPYKSSGGKMVWNDELKREIPEGWDVNRLADLITYNRGVSYTAKDLSESGTPIISLASIDREGRYIPDGIKFYDSEYSDSKVLKPYDLIMANTDMTQERAVMGKIIFVPDIFNGDVLSTHHITKVSIRNELKAYFMMTTQTEWFHNYIKGFSSGTNVLGMDMVGFEKYQLVCPPDTLLNNFDEYIYNVYAKVFSIYTENRDLTSLRDFLLPMLMNGQVKVGKAGA